jgi:HD-GYP domain-containing protein (c-di-GMP phosphodiesterase class II)/HAMP domain-containing protein
MSRFKIGTLQNRLIFLTILTVIPLLGLILYTDIQQRQNAKKTAQQDALRLIHIAVIEQEQLLRSANQLLVALAQLPAVQDDDPTECQNVFANLLVQYTFYSGFTVVTPEGDVICSVPTITTPVNFTDRSWFQQELQIRGFIVGEYLVGRISGKSVIVLSYPILDATKQLQGVVAVGLDLSWFDQLFSEVDLPPDSAYTVIDQNGTVMARFPDPEKWIGQAVSEAPLIEEILNRQGEGTLEMVGIDGVKRLYAFAPLSSVLVPETYVLVGIPRTVAYAQANRILKTNLAGLGMVLALALVLAWFSGHVFVMRNMSALIQVTKQVESGDLSARSGLSSGAGEFNQLGQAFDHMADSLQLHDIEIKQAEAALRKSNRVLSLISACNQALIRAQEETEFLHKICQLLVELGEYRMVWVGLCEHNQEKAIRPIAHAGYEDGYLDKIDISCVDSESGGEPISTAIRTGEPIIARDILADPDFFKRGYANLIALPLIENNQVIGVLNIYTGKFDVIDEEEVNCLEELAGDLTYGISMLRIRAQHQQAEEKIRRQLEKMEALWNIDSAITASLDLRHTLNVLLEQITKTLKIDAVCVLLLNPYSQILQYAAGRGFRTQALRNTSLRFGEGYAGNAALKKRMVYISHIDQTENGFQKSPRLHEEGFITYFAFPLIAKGQVNGVLEIFNRTYFEPDHEWLDFLEALSMQAAIAVDNAALFDDIQQTNIELTIAYDSTLEGWSRALDLRDKATEGHTERVTKVTIGLARSMGIHEADIIQIRRGAILHDIGKMGIPDIILHKPGPLSDEEWEIMRRHPTYAYQLLSPIAYLRPALDIPYCHHEKWDGTGYPRSLRGEQIPLAARIFAVVDVWDALISDRPYRLAWTEETTFEYLKEQSGKYFDPQVVTKFLEVRDSLPNLKFIK